jgi:hypothetical protein
MTPPPALPPFSRRTGIRLAAAIFLAGPAAATAAARQVSPGATDHPAVGTWLAEFRGFQPPAYIVLHANGTGTFHTAGTPYFTSISDPAQPMTGVITWRPVDDTTIDAVVHVTWGDATDETTMTIRLRWTVDEDADTASALTRVTHMDADGTVINRASDRFDASRLTWESFEDAATPQASPAT